MSKELIGIVAVELNDGIGNNNNLPWHIKADLRYFKTTTMGHTLVMGRNTFESIGGGRPLPGRTTIVMSLRPQLSLPEGVLHARSLEEAVALAPTDKIFICGGGQIYQQAMPKIGRWHITYIKAALACDAYLSGFVADEWCTVHSVEVSAGSDSPYDLEIVELARK